MKNVEWNENDLRRTQCIPNLNRGCCVPDCDCEEPAMFDFKLPEGQWVGHAYCAKHAEMLKEAQWANRQRQTGGNT